MHIFIIYELIVHVFIEKLVYINQWGYKSDIVIGFWNLNIVNKRDSEQEIIEHIPRY